MSCINIYQAFTQSYEKIIFKAKWSKTYDKPSKCINTISKRSICHLSINAKTLIDHHHFPNTFQKVHLVTTKQSIRKLTIQILINQFLKYCLYATICIAQIVLKRAQLGPDHLQFWPKGPKPYKITLQNVIAISNSSTCISNK